MGGGVVFAVIKTGGKQYVVEPGMKLVIEKLEGEVSQEVEFTDVLLVKKGDEVLIGQPKVKGAKVVAKILEHSRGPKIIVFKKKPKKGYKRKKGHRQWYTLVEIKEIVV